MHLRVDLDFANRLGGEVMRIERHILGSVSGYVTLARSTGLSEPECRQLESLSFGTPYDSSYHTSLSKRMAWWSRPLGSGKRAVTRVLPGEPDDAGRPTLLFVTAALAEDEWDHLLQGDVRVLLGSRALWQWDGAAKLAALDLKADGPLPLRMNRTALARVLGLISLVELSWTARQPVVVRPEHYSMDEIAAVERFLPASARRSYSAVYRSLNPDLAASVNCLAEGIAAGTSNPARRLDTAKSPYALRLEEAGFTEGHAADALLVKYDGFGQPHIEVAGARVEDQAVGMSVNQSQRADAAKGDMLVSAPVLLLSLLAVLLVGVAVGWLTRAAGESPVQAAKPASPAWKTLLGETLVLAGQDRAGQLKKLESIQEELGRPEFDTVGQAAELRQTVAKEIEIVGLVRAAENCVRKIKPDNTASVSAARASLDALRHEHSDLVVLLQDWSEAKQRPTEDRFPEICEQMRAAVTERMTKLETAGALNIEDSIDQGRELLTALELFASAAGSSSPKWIAERISYLKILIDESEKELAKRAELAKAENKEQQTGDNEKIAKLLEQATKLSDALQQAKETPGKRGEVGHALQNLTELGRDSMGKTYSQGLDALAEWILDLRDVTEPERIEAVQGGIDECLQAAKELRRACQDLDSENKTWRENNDIVIEVRKKAAKLDKLFEELEKLLAEVEKDARPRGDEQL